MSTRLTWPENPSLPYIIHWSLRRDDQCKMSGCPDALEIRDPVDGGLLERQPCEYCIVPKLQAAVQANPIIARVFDFDFALSAGFTMSLNDINVEEFRLLKVLRTEKNRYQEEMQRRAARSR